MSETIRTTRTGTAARAREVMLETYREGRHMRKVGHSLRRLADALERAENRSGNWAETLMAQHRRDVAEAR